MEAVWTPTEAAVTYPLNITNAGLKTALQSLSFVVPMVAIPIANNQPGVAVRATWSGRGSVV